MSIHVYEIHIDNKFPSFKSSDGLKQNKSTTLSHTDYLGLPDLAKIWDVQLNFNFQ